MKAAVLYEYRSPLKIEEVELNEPSTGEVMVKIIASGVCHSDWHVVKGDIPTIQIPSILGHEGSGIVEAVGPGVTTLKLGDHVVLTWKPGCGKCAYCQQGWPAVCELFPTVRSRPSIRSTGTKVNQMVGLGSFGSSTVVPELAAVPIDKDIPFPQAALIGCAVTTGVGAVINTARVQSGTSVAVFGCGGVGLNCIQGADLAGATTIIAVDLRENKLEMAREFGATHTINASNDDPVERIIDLTGGEGAQYAFEAIGLAPDPYVQSVLCTRRRGLTVWVGVPPEGMNVTINAKALFHEKMVMGSYYGSSRPRIDFGRISSLYKAGKLKLDELISRTFQIEEINTAFKALDQGQVARGVISYE